MTNTLQRDTDLLSTRSPAPAFDHERVVTARGPRSGAVITVALHSSRLGPALGGARLWTYRQWTDGVDDALRLSAAMTLKNSAAGLDAGGGKSVIALAPGETLDPARRRDVFLDLGELVESFGGLYRTAEDVGSTEHDMLVVREQTAHVVGLPAEDGGAGEPAGPTALGVFASIRATAAEAFGSPELRGRRIVVSGLGQVGSRLAQRLAEAGAELTVSDINPARREFADALGARWLGVDEVLSTSADVLVPAGIGGVLTAPVIESLDVAAVVGPANNPLADRSGAARLAERGILYAPDFIVNAGGVIYLSLAGTVDASAIETRVMAIGDTLASVYATARAESITPVEAAERLALRRIAAAR